MPLAISKDCFPAPTTCFNCERKSCSHVKKDPDPKEEYKRCSGCHLLTYCDKDCQREHWLKLHKSHCRFLSGKVPVKNCQHNAATCSQCRDRRQANITQIRSKNSPTTVCTIEAVTRDMKNAIGACFGFHDEDFMMKKCDCSQEFALNLPFPLGEVSGQYMEIGSTGLDAMLAHSLKILNAMFVKAGQEEQKSILKELHTDILSERSKVWTDTLIYGVPSARKRQYLSEKVDKLRAVYEASNPWFKTLKFSVEFVINTNRNLFSSAKDSRSLEDPRFPKLKILHDYHLSQLMKQAIVCEKKMWPNFMLWPALVNGKLVMILPPGTTCQSCLAQLCGEASMSVKEVKFKTLPSLLVQVGDNGALMASCPVARNPNCRKDCLSKNAMFEMQSEEDCKEILREKELFLIEARDCDFCLKMSLSSHRCSGCFTVQYCSTVCQKKDLEFHKSVCAIWAKDKSRRILGKGRQKDYWKSSIGETKKELLRN